MIQKLKNKFLRFESEVSKMAMLQKDSLALIQLQNLFDKNVYLPLTSWSISPSEVLHICNDIIINKRKNIIEFGSGFSTLCIAQVLKVNNVTSKVYSIENDENWIETLNSMLINLKLTDFVEIIYIPITEVSTDYSKATQKKWYSVQELDKHFADKLNIDLIIVDGPFGGSTPYARYSALPYLKNKLSDDFSIFLDDTSRKDEGEIASDWKADLKCTVVDKGRYTYFTSKKYFDVTPFGI